MNKPVGIILGFGVVILLVAGFLVWQSYISPTIPSSGRSARVLEWIRQPASHPEWSIAARQTCADAPFQTPTSGLVGYLWDDTFQPGHRHQGIDIFGGGQPGETPVYAAYTGYLTRLADWKSTVIIRIPSDPLHPSRQIWTYYTHMANPDGDSLVAEAFPPGVEEAFVEQGSLLGYQGNYSGDPSSPVGVHLHFSIVQDDGMGKYKNELEIGNTLDPSPYFNLALNAGSSKDEVVTCASNQPVEE